MLSGSFKELKCEVLQQGIELQKMKISRLAAELSELRGTEHNLEEQTRILQQHIQDLGQPAAALPERTEELESARSHSYAWLGTAQITQRELRGQTAERKAELKRATERLAQLLHRFAEARLSLEKKVR
jgi:hypothetical protein